MHLETHSDTHETHGENQEVESERGEDTYPVAVVADFNDEVILTQVPDWRSPTGVGWGQDVLDLSVPGHEADVLHGLSDKSQTATVKNCICMHDTPQLPSLGIDWQGQNSKMWVLQ